MDRSSGGSGDGSPDGAPASEILGSGEIDFAAGEAASSFLY